MAKHPAIIMKFAIACDQSAGKREITKWVGRDIVDSKPLFPDADDAELSTIYEIYLKDDCQVHTVVKKLQEQDSVEYAHEPAERKET